jgi:hypothetical protein
MRFVKALGMLLILWTSAVHAQETTALTNPIAYIGHDQNLYLTDGTTTVPVTTDAALDEFGIGIVYEQPHWSPDGTQLVFFREYTSGAGAAMMLAASGEPVRELIAVPEVSDTYFENHLTAWSPDNAEIAFIGSYGEQWGLFAVSVDNGNIRFIAEPIAPSIGEGGGDDPAKSVAATESGGSAYRERYIFSWTEDGILLSPTNSCICLQLMTSAGESLQEWAYGSEILNTFAQPFVLSRNTFDVEQPIMLIDVAHPAEVALELPEAARPMAFMDGALYYVTRTDVREEVPTFETQTGVPLEDQWMWGFNAESATLQLWRDDPVQEDTLIFETEGYDFGVVRPTADNRLLVSVISSNREALIAVNSGATPEEVQELGARPTIYVIDGDAVILTIDGGQPDASSDEYTVVSEQ